MLPALRVGTFMKQMKINNNEKIYYFVNMEHFNTFEMVQITGFGTFILSVSVANNVTNNKKIYENE